MTEPVWDDFMDRVIEAQRQIARGGGSPYRYAVYVATDYYVRLEPYLGRTGLPVYADPSMAGTAITLRHEVEA